MAAGASPGRWRRRLPVDAACRTPAAAYPFLPVEGEGLHQIPVGPVHAGIIEPGHFRFTASGETVVRLEERLGYVHKGIDGLIRGADIATAARLAGRTSGDSTRRLRASPSPAPSKPRRGTAPPPRAVRLRALMAELERLANHLGDIGAICNDAAFALMHAHTAVLRERVLRFAADRLRPSPDDGPGRARRRSTPTSAPDGRGALAALLGEIRRAFPRLVELYDSTASLLDRTVGTGRLDPALAAQFAPGGYVGRASGLPFDVAPRPRLSALRRARLRGAGPRRRRRQCAGLDPDRRGRAEPGADRADRRAAAGRGRSRPTSRNAAGEGMAIVEGFRGPVLAWLRLGGNGRVARCHLRDPSWFQWPLLEAVIEGNIVADFPLCNKSFNCSYSGPRP